MKTPLPADYENRVYAGVLGKIIGVYLGRPCENWSHQAITNRWGEIRRYIHADQKVPLIVTDDDITGTFTFVRALLDHGIKPDLSSREIGQTWLNYIAEGRHILWWGGRGMSAEHTSFLQLDAGIEAPRSGSIGLNGTGVAEEIGAQIFIDGWALVSPGNPDLAVRLAREAARVSHDGEAVHGAIMVAAMEAMAFVEQDIHKLIDKALTFIPADSEISRLIVDLRRWHSEHPEWRQALALLIEHYGYEKYGTNCPMVSNHGVIILSLLYGDGDFDRSMMIVNTAGYDTDCNAANVGCLLGIRNGLSALSSGYDWRTPVNDRMYLPSADGHWGMRDAATMAMEIANIGRVLAGERPRRPKNGARYHFELPGSTHGFAPSGLCPLESRLSPVDKALRVRVEFPGARSDAEVASFLTPEAMAMPNYGASATPALYAGNLIHAQVHALPGNATAVRARLFVRAYQAAKETTIKDGPWIELMPGGAALLEWTAPETNGWPVFAVGVELDGSQGAEMDIESLTWNGTPTLVFAPPETCQNHESLTIWQRIFIHNLEQPFWGWSFPINKTVSLIKNRGRGIIHTGAREWTDYRVSVKIKPWTVTECGVAARVQGLTRQYALLLRPGNQALLVRMAHEETVLAEVTFHWSLRSEYELTLEVRGEHLTGFVDGQRLLTARDSVLTEGGIGLIVSNGRVNAHPLRIEAL